MVGLSNSSLPAVLKCAWEPSGRVLHVCVYTCAQSHVCTAECLQVLSLYLCVSACVHWIVLSVSGSVYICVSVYTSVHLCMSVYLCLGVFVCVCISA